MYTGKWFLRCLWNQFYLNVRVKPDLIRAKREEKTEAKEGCTFQKERIDWKKIIRKNGKWKRKMRGSTAGLTDITFEKGNPLHDALLAFLDVAFASIIVTPAILTHWRGTWNLWKMYVFPDDLFSSGITFIGIGTIGQFIIIYAQNILDHTFHPDKHRLTFMTVSRLYTLIYAAIGIAGWLGMWDLLDVYCPPDISLLCTIIVVGSFLLALLKGLRNVSSPPFGISTDNSKDYFVITTMFKSSVRIRK